MLRAHAARNHNGIGHEIDSLWKGEIARNLGVEGSVQKNEPTRDAASGTGFDEFFNLCFDRVANRTDLYEFFVGVSLKLRWIGKTPMQSSGRPRKNRAALR